MVFTTIDSSLVPSAQNNILDNGGFEIWQRGTSFGTLLNAYCADRWNFSTNGGGTWTITQENSVVDSGNFSLKWNVTAVNTPNENGLFLQFIENYKAYANKTLTLSVRVWANAANCIRLVIGDGNGSATSTFHPGDSSWHTLTCTYAMSSNPSILEVGMGVVSSGGNMQVHTSYYDSAVLVLGPNPATFTPANPQVDLARCQRFFQRIGTAGTTAGENFATGFVYTNTFATFVMPYLVTMRAAPTVTFGPTNPGSFQVNGVGGGNVAVTNISTVGVYINRFSFTITVSSGLVAGNATVFQGLNNQPAFIDLSADL